MLIAFKLLLSKFSNMTELIFERDLALSQVPLRGMSQDLGLGKHSRKLSTPGFEIIHIINRFIRILGAHFL